MSTFSGTEPCPTCNGKGTTAITQPVSKTRTTISCSACNGTGSVCWEI